MLSKIFLFQNCQTPGTILGIIPICRDSIARNRCLDRDFSSKPIRYGFQKKYYSEKEWQYVMRNPQKNATRLWTLKESYVKLTGTGIIKKLPEIEISELVDNFSQIIEGEQYYLSEFTFIDGYSLSVCSREKQQIKKTQD